MLRLYNNRQTNTEVNNDKNSKNDKGIIYLNNIVRLTAAAITINQMYKE